MNSSFNINNNNNNNSNSNTQSNNNNNNNEVDENHLHFGNEQKKLEEELNFIAFNWLSRNSTLKSPILSTLYSDLNRNNLLPKCNGWDGSVRDYTYNELKKKYNYISPDYMKQVFNQCTDLSYKHGHLADLAFKFKTFLGDGNYSLIPPPTVNNNNNSSCSDNNNTFKLHNHPSKKVPTNVYKDYPVLLPPPLPQLPNQEIQPIDVDQPITIISPTTTTTSTTTTSTSTSTTTTSTTTSIITIGNQNNTNPSQAKPTTSSKRLRYRTFSDIQQFNVDSDGLEDRLDLKLISSELYNRRSKMEMTDLPIDIYRDYNNTLIVLGHKAPTYCFSFDKSGRIFITGSDDHLIKIWLTCSGRLLYTLRGHFGDITDMSINLDNSILASASNDSIIRLWSLTSFEPIKSLQGHNPSVENEITSVAFCPNPLNKHLLLSSDKFGVLRIWNLNDIEKSFNLLTTREITTILGASFNKGGTLIIASVGNTIMIWSMLFYPPKLVNTLEGHTTPINAIQFSHSSDAIVSGSLDGNVIVWRHEYGTTWNHILFKTTNHQKPAHPNSRNRKKSSFNILNSTFKNVIWSLTDKYIITSNDNVVAVWNSFTGELHLEMIEHKKEVYVLSCHPHDERLIMSSGYDAQVILWNIETGEPIKKFSLEEPGANLIPQDPLAYSTSDILDGSFSPDGTRFTVTNGLGKWFMFELGSGSSKEFYRDVPNEQYFFTDYHPLVKDSYGYVLDELTQQPPHLLPRSLLVNFQGMAYQQQPSIDIKYYLKTDFKDTMDYQRILDRQQEFEKKEITTFNKGTEDQKDIEANPIVVHIPQVPVAKPKPKPQPRKKPAPLPVQPTFTQPSLMELLEAYDDDVVISDPSDMDYEESSESSTSEAEDNKNNSNSSSSSSDISDDERRKDRMMINDEEISDDNSDTSTESLHSYSSDLPKSRRKSKIKETRKRKALKNSKLLTRSNTSPTKLNKIINDLGDLEDYDDSMNLDNSNDNIENDFVYNNDVDIDDQLLGLVTKKENRGRPKKQNSTTHNKRNSKPVKTSSNITNSTSIKAPATNTPAESIQCPKWISTTSISIYDSYYSPQIGDTVYYFYQGHQKYIEQFPFDRNNQQQSLMPNHLSNHIGNNEFPHLKSTQECLVKKLDYYISGQGIHRAEITLMNTESCEQFVCNYHVGDDPDFLVLASKVKYSLSLGWKVGMKFKMYYPDSEAWYNGVIIEVSTSSSLYPDSPWERLKVLWDNAEDEERLSFWEIVQLDETETQLLENTNLNNNNNLNSNDNNQDPNHGLFIQLKEKVENSISPLEVIDPLVKNEITINLKQYMKKKITLLYREPVDLNIYPLYIRFVPHPMDIKTILSRLENDYYRRLESFYFDSFLLMKDAFIYNKANTSIAKNSRIVFKGLLKILSESNYAPFSMLELETMDDLNKIIKENNEGDDDAGDDQDENESESESESESDYTEDGPHPKQVANGATHKRGRGRPPTTTTTTTTTSTNRKRKLPKKKKKNLSSSDDDDDYQSEDEDDDEPLVLNEESDYSDDSEKNHVKKKLKTNNTNTKPITKRKNIINHNDSTDDEDIDYNNVQKTNRRNQSIYSDEEDYNDEDDEDDDE